MREISRAALEFNYLVCSLARQGRLAHPEVTEIPDHRCSLCNSLGKSAIDFRQCLRCRGITGQNNESPLMKHASKVITSRAQNLQNSFVRFAVTVKHTMLGFVRDPELEKADTAFEFGVSVPKMDKVTAERDLIIRNAECDLAERNFHGKFTVVRL
jgi:hypothetical protein